MTLLLFFFLLGVGVWGCTDVSTVVNLDSLRLPRRSYEAARALRDQRDLFVQPNTHQPTIRVYAVTEGVDFFANMDALDSLNTQLVRTRHCQVTATHSRLPRSQSHFLRALCTLSFFCACCSGPKLVCALGLRSLLVEGLSRLA